MLKSNRDGLCQFTEGTVTCKKNKRQIQKGTEIDALRYLLSSCYMAGTMQSGGHTRQKDRLVLKELMVKTEMDNEAPNDCP